MKPLTFRMVSVIGALYENDRPLTPNEIGSVLGFRTGHVPGRPQRSRNGKCLGPAQRVIFALIGLRDRGLVRMVRRRDGLSGTAYELTGAGLAWRHANAKREALR